MKRLLAKVRQFLPTQHERSESREVSYKWYLSDFLRHHYADPRSLEPGRLIRHGFKVYSQHDEDGLLAEVFERIGVTNRVFVEFGVGDGLENNTLFLLFRSWSGLWIEGGANSYLDVCRNVRPFLERKALKVQQAMLTKDNINEVISSAGVPEEIDLLSIDVDGNDYHLMKVLSVVNARVVTIEYNAKLPPPTLFVMTYNATHVWDGTDYCGASLTSLELMFREKGYCLVGCSINGGNAIFVRADLVGNKFHAPFTAENHYEPPRYWLTPCYRPILPPRIGSFESR